ncbi:helix-turn-helix domain-containing protein [Nannocystis pusilla]|uniref:helix-turn-helix domain-containing protein n=1 Tax=Nannocystis pusilla TaxID=889268 RepID=UPI003B7BF061
MAPKPDRQQLGQALAGARLRRGFSVEEAAAATQHEPRSLRNWEGGRTSPDALALLALADLYGISLEALVGRAPLPPRGQA